MAEIKANTLNQRMQFVWSDMKRQKKKLKTTDILKTITVSVIDFCYTLILKAYNREL